MRPILAPVLGTLVLLLATDPAVAGLPYGRTRGPADGAMGGLVFADGHAVSVRPPEGWVIDNVAGRGEGLPAVLHPRGTSFSEADTTMAASLLTGGRQDAVAQDLTRLRSRWPAAVVSDEPGLPTAGGRVALVRRLSGEDGAHAVAWVDEGEFVTRLWLRARSADALERSLPAFRQLVASHAVLPGVRVTKTAVR